MKKLFVITVLAVALLAPKLAHAQTPAGLPCGSFDTITNSTTPVATLGSCTFTTGPYGIIFAVATAEVECGVNLTSQIFIGTGASPVNGSNFLGHASSGTLTIESLIPGIGTPPWLIQTGQLLSPGSGATPFTGTAITGQTSQATYSVTGSISATTLTVSASGSGTILFGSTVTGAGVTGGTTITGQIDSTHYVVSISQTVASTTISGTNPVGTLGTYSIANGSLTITGGSNLYTLNAIPGGATAITPAMNQTACTGGFTLSAIAGAFTGAPRTQYWLDVGIFINNGANFGEWNNAQIAIFTY